MDRQTLTNRFRYFAVVLFIALIAYFIIGTDKHREKALKGPEEVATIYKKDFRRLRFKYIVNNTEMSTSSEELDPDVYRSFKVGEKYVVKYNPEDPQWAVIMYHLPVIEGGKFAETKSVSITGRGRMARFEYYVDGEKCTRFQVIDPDKDFDPERYERNAYLIKYRLEDPSLGYIFLDSLVELRTGL